MEDVLRLLSGGDNEIDLRGQGGFVGVAELNRRMHIKRRSAIVGNHDIYRSQRCVLIPLARDNERALHLLWTSPGVRRYLWDDKVIDIRMTLDIVQRSMRHRRRREYGLWVASAPDAADLMGFVGFWPFHQPPRIELIFGVAESHWHRGYATELATIMLERVAPAFDIRPVLASLDAANTASRAVLKKLGFRQTHSDKATDTLFYELVR